MYLGIMPECHCPENHSFLRMAIWLRGLERWYLVLGGVAVGCGFEPQSDLELSFAKILLKSILKGVHNRNKQVKKSTAEDWGYLKCNSMKFTGIAKNREKGN
jgi:hypothetical protein